MPDKHCSDKDTLRTQSKCHQSLEAKSWCTALQRLSPSQGFERQQLLSQFALPTNETNHFFVEQGLQLTVVESSNLQLGSGVFINHNVLVDNLAPVVIEDKVFIGPNTMLITCIGDVQKPITIEKGAWLGANVLICPGVTIGKGSIIGAGTTVQQNVPEKCTAYGNPLIVSSLCNE